MDDLRAIALQEIINRQFMEKKDAIAKEIIEGCEEEDSMEEIYSMMIFNAIKIATRLSTGIIVDMLIELGLAEPADEDKSRRGILKVIK